MKPLSNEERERIKDRCGRGFLLSSEDGVRLLADLERVEKSSKLLVEHLRDSTWQLLHDCGTHIALLHKFDWPHTHEPNLAEAIYVMEEQDDTT